MDFLRVLFNDDALTYDEFVEVLNKNGIKLADLSKGDYVAKKKYEDEIANLNNALSQRDTDLEGLKTKLTEAGGDAEKLSQLSSEFESLRTKYDDEVKNYKAQLKKQQYEFAVKDFAASKHFSSNAARRDFINSMISADLKMNEKGILGGEDFVKQYASENEDAFIPEVPETREPKPMFVETSHTPEYVDDSNLFNFNFTGVRSHED